MNKTYDSLRRLKKTRGGGFSMFSSSTAATAADDETDKVRLQMEVDVDAFGQEARSLGIRLDQSVAWQALRACVFAQGT